jgi:hypothetical protein
VLTTLPILILFAVGCRQLLSGLAAGFGSDAGSFAARPTGRDYRGRMASTADSRPDLPGPPTALAAHTPRVIRDALTGRERIDFERRYADEMSIAATTLDLTGVLTVLDTFRTIAEITQRQGPETHQHMLDQIDRIQRGDHVATVSGNDHKAEIDRRSSR